MRGERSAEIEAVRYPDPHWRKPDPVELPREPGALRLALETILLLSLAMLGLAAGAMISRWL